MALSSFAANNPTLAILLLSDSSFDKLLISSSTLEISFLSRAASTVIVPTLNSVSYPVLSVIYAVIVCFPPGYV